MLPKQCSEWQYNDVRIIVDNQGVFGFEMDGFVYTDNTLNKAKRKINELSKKKYSVSQYQWDNLLKKLDKREKQLVKDMQDIILEVGDYDSFYLRNFKWCGEIFPMMDVYKNDGLEDNDNDDIPDELPDENDIENE